MHPEIFAKIALNAEEKKIFFRRAPNKHFWLCPQKWEKEWIAGVGRKTATPSGGSINDLLTWMWGCWWKISCELLICSYTFASDIEAKDWSYCLTCSSTFLPKAGSLAGQAVESILSLNLIEVTRGLRFDTPLQSWSDDWNNWWIKYG